MGNGERLVSGLLSGSGFPSLPQSHPGLRSTTESMAYDVLAPEVAPPAVTSRGVELPSNGPDEDPAVTGQPAGRRQLAMPASAIPVSDAPTLPTTSFVAGLLFMLGLIHMLVGRVTQVLALWRPGASVRGRGHRGRRGRRSRYGRR